MFNADRWNNRLRHFADTLDALRDTSKATKKTAVLEQYLSEHPYGARLFNLALSPEVQFHLTSKNIRKDAVPLSAKKMPMNPFFSLMQREVTGHKAQDLWLGFINQLSRKSANAAVRILDKDLQARVGVASLNKVLEKLELPLITVVSVALGKTWKGEPIWKNPNDYWFISRKLDGVRCLIFLDWGHPPVFLSRQGKVINTLSTLGASLIPKSDIWMGEATVLDGELAIQKDGKDDFKAIMKVVRKKNYDIKNVVYNAFDMLTLEEFQTRKGAVFSERQRRLHAFQAQYKNPHIKIVEQTTQWNEKTLFAMMEKAKRLGWEGLILRKEAPYVGKRSNDIMKFKPMHDAEYKVIATETSFRGIVIDGKEVRKKCLARAIVQHKGNKVGVGSGFSQKQVLYYGKHPEKLIGKTITVQYMEETKSKKGTFSLRHPVIKHIHGNAREF